MGCGRFVGLKRQCLQPGRTITIEGIEVFPFHVPHEVNKASLALTVNYNGKQILLSGDFAWTDALLGARSVRRRFPSDECRPHDSTKPKLLVQDACEPR